jgi:hypothetical protein
MEEKEEKEKEKEEEEDEKEEKCHPPPTFRLSLCQVPPPFLAREDEMAGGGGLQDDCCIFGDNQPLNSDDARITSSASGATACRKLLLCPHFHCLEWRQPSPPPCYVCRLLRLKV